MSNFPRVVVVTGASAGVGRATVREFARRGATIGLIARGEDGLLAARREVEAIGGRALVCPADVADADAIEAAAARIEAELGPIDAWVNNAMNSVFAPVLQTTPDEYRRVTEVTYLGYVYGTLAALKRMTPRDEGVIVQVGSALAYRSIPLQSAYCAAKAAIRGFTDSLRSELIHDGSHVRVTAVHLPALNTPQFDWVRSKLPNKGQPVPPIYAPEVAARAIVRAAVHPRREYFVAPTTLKAFLGQKFVPGYADRKLAKDAYGAQQRPEPQPVDAPDNLYAPLPGDRGAHGSFTALQKSRTLPLWLTSRPGQLTLTVAGVVPGALALGLAALRHRDDEAPTDR